jgi:transposase
MFYAIDLEDRIRADHPLRPIKVAVDGILAELGPLFDRAYSRQGRPSVPPEVLLKALVLQCLYSIRSERQLVERLDTDLLFRWFCGLDPAEDVFDATAFTHNRPRLDEHGITGAFFDAVSCRAMHAGLTSDDHFSVDGTLIESYASIKSFKPLETEDDEAEDDGDGFKSRNAEVDFQGKKRSNTTHRSTTDPEARLYRKSKGQGAKLAHLAHVISENRHGLIMAVSVTEANGRAECAAALEMIDTLLDRSIQPKTLGADRGYDSGPFMIELESRGVTPHTAMLDTTRNPKTLKSRDRAAYEARQRMRQRLKEEVYAISQRARKKVEEVFGWLKTIAGLARSRHVGRWKLRQQMQLGAAIYNLVRMRKLLA